MDTQQQFDYEEAARIAREEAELNLDLDGDGLSTRDERSMGINPYRGDSDGDHELDGAELTRGGNPGERFDLAQVEQERERLRTSYFEIVSDMLGWENMDLDWQKLSEHLDGNKLIGRNLDYVVFNQAIDQGEPPSQAVYLLAQSPFLQYHKERGSITADDIVAYSQQMQSEYETNHPIVEKEADYELERRS